MKTYNLTSFTKYWKEIAIIVLMFVCFFSCKRQQELSGLNLTTEILKDSIKKSESKITDLDKKITTSKEKLKALDVREKDAISDIEVLVDAVEKKKQQYSSLEKKEKDLHNIIKSYNTNDIASYISERYEIPTAVSTLPYATVVQDTVGRMIVNDLVSLDVARVKIKYKDETIALKDSIISGKDTVIDIKDKKIVEYKTIVDTHEKEKIEYVKIADNQTKVILNGEKTIRKQKRKVTVGGIVIIILTSLLILK